MKKRSHDVPATEALDEYQQHIYEGQRAAAITGMAYGLGGCIVILAFTIPATITTLAEVGRQSFTLSLAGLLLLFGGVSLAVLYMAGRTLLELKRLKR